MRLSLQYLFYEFKYLFYFILSTFHIMLINKGFYTPYASVVVAILSRIYSILYYINNGTNDSTVFILL